MFAIDYYDEQPYYYVLEGNVTYAVDLASYRDQIIATVRPECSDEVENDGDGLVDFPNDPGCKSAEDLSEAADCNDGLDNDGDGLGGLRRRPGLPQPSRMGVRRSRLQRRRGQRRRHARRRRRSRVRGVARVVDERSRGLPSTAAASASSSSW